MPFEKSLALFPKGSRFPALLRGLAAPGEARRYKAYERIDKLDPIDSWEDARTPNWSIAEQEAHAILKAAAAHDFPAPENDWQDGLADLIGLLWRSPHRSLVADAGAAYPRLATASRKCAALALLGIIGTREAAETFIACVSDHGWPDGIYSRVFEELENLLAHLDVLLPELVVSAGKRYAAEVGRAILGAMARGLLKPADAGDRLEALAPFVVTSLKKLLASAAKQQDKPGIGWRFTERYSDTRREAGLYLDLSGYLREPKLLPLLREAARFKDPHLAAYAALALLRRGESAPPAAINRAAASHETRALIFEGLRELKKEKLFPAKWRTWDAFAAARMVEWLLYPTELGREPDELELMHVEQTDRRKKEALYVWRFRVGKEPWRAGVSGPHHLAGKPAPLDGTYTFSRFDKWDECSALEHAERCVGTVNEMSGG
jgi:hypothetical protein